jgi:hypothetical protein
MNDYIKGILTGASLILCFFMFVSAKSDRKNLGDISVSSLFVVNEENGKLMMDLGYTSKGGGMTIWNDKSEIVGLLGVSDNIRDGSVKIFAADGEETVFLGTGQGGGGHIETHNKNGLQTGYFGTNKSNDGMAVLFDRYGDIGWSASGKK